MVPAVRVAFTCSLLLGCVLAQRPAPSNGLPPAVNFATIRVKLLSRDAKPPAGILVVLENQSGAEMERMMTDSRGVAEFTNVELGLYRVHVRQLGFHSAVQSVDVTLSPSATVVLDLISDQPGAPPVVPPGGPRDTISANVPATDSGKKLLAQGEAALFEKRDAKEGLSFMDKLVKEEPEYANGWVLRGLALMQLQRVPDAESSFRKAVSVKPGDYAAQFALAVSLNTQNRFKDALAPLAEALKINPNSAEADFEMSRSYFGLGQWQLAEPFVTKGLESNKDFAPLHVAMGNILLKKKDREKALAEYETYLRMAPDGVFAPEVKQVSDGLRQSLSAKK